MIVPGSVATRLSEVRRPRQAARPAVAHRARGVIHVLAAGAGPGAFWWGAVVGGGRGAAIHRSARLAAARAVAGGPRGVVHVVASRADPGALRRLLLAAALRLARRAEPAHEAGKVLRRRARVSGDAGWRGLA